MVRSIFVQTVFWKAASAVSWALVSLLTIRLFQSVEQFGLVSPALLVLGSLPALDGGFRVAINRRLLAARDDQIRTEHLAFGQRLSSWFSSAATLFGVLVLVAYSFTPNARSSGVSALFYPALGLTSGLILLASALLQQLTGLGLQRRMFALQLLMAWLSLATLWAGFRSGAGIWSFLLSQGLPHAIAIALAIPMVRTASPGLRLLDFSWSKRDTQRLRELWPDSSALLQMQVWTLLLYTVDVFIVSWIWKGPQVGQYSLVANLFSKLRNLLQSADEAVWPLLTSKQEKGETISSGVLRFNGLLYGGAMAVAAVATGPFIIAYKDPTWSSGGLFAALMGARYLITGIASQPAWWLYGHGHLATLAGHMRRELAVSVMLCVPLGWFLGATGIALAFVLGTVAGTLLPIPLEYARRSGRNPTELLLQVWTRSLLAGLAAAALALLGLGFGGPWWNVVIASGLALALTLGASFGLAAWRARRAGATERIAIARHL